MEGAKARAAAAAAAAAPPTGLVLRFVGNRRLVNASPPHDDRSGPSGPRKNALGPSEALVHAQLTALCGSSSCTGD